MANKSFKDWTQTELKNTFGLVKQKGLCVELEQWIADGDALKKSAQLSDNEHFIIDTIIAKLNDNVDSWNEEELKMYFISPLLLVVNIESEHYKLFFERKLNALKNNIKLNGKVDAMLASGSFDKPQKPYFCLHEYKPEKSGKESDPRGQLLSEMLAAQTLNDDGKIIYGCYFLGRLWFFATLVGNEFCFSNGFTADEKQSLLRIIFILRQLKTYIDERIEKQ
jgi:hypothetical protein